MPGFPLAALGAGLGQWAKFQQEQQAARERQQMLMLTLQKFQQEQQDRREGREGDKAEWGTLLGGGGAGINPVNPMGGSSGGVGVPTQNAGGADPLSLISKYESNGQNIKNPTSSASGPWQFLDSTWRETAPTVGINTAQYPTAMSAPVEMQRRAAQALYDKQGYKPWAPYNPRLAAAIGSGASAAPADSGGPAGRPTQVADESGQIPGYPTIRPGAAGKADRDYIRANPREMQVADASGAQPADASGGGAGEAQVAENVPPESLRKVEQSIPTEVRGRMSAEALARQIEQNCPNCSETAKLKALKSKLQLLAPQERERMQLEFQRNTQIFTEEMANKRAARAEAGLDKRQAFTEAQAARRAADQNWDLLTDTTTGTQYYVQKGHPETAKDLSGQPYKPGGAQRLGGGGTGSASAGREADVAKEIIRRDAEWDAAHPGASNSDKSKAHFENRKAAEKELTVAKTSETRSTLANIAMRKLRDEHPEWDGKDLLRESSKIIAQQAIDRNYAGGTGAANMRALNTVADHLKLMKEYAAALRDGAESFADIPRLNQIVQFIAKERGMPEVTNFNVARDIMTGEVVRLLTSTGGTREDRAGMASNLNAAMSEYQQTGSITAFERFTAGRFKGLEQGYARNDAERTKVFRDDMLTPEAREIFTKHGSASEATPATPAAGGGPTGRAAPGTAAPPPRAVEMLRQDKRPNARQEFDAIFGPGAAAKALGGAAPEAPRRVYPVWNSLLKTWLNPATGERLPGPPPGEP